MMGLVLDVLTVVRSLPVCQLIYLSVGIARQLQDSNTVSVGMARITAAVVLAVSPLSQLVSHVLQSGYNRLRRQNCGLWHLVVSVCIDSIFLYWLERHGPTMNAELRMLTTGIRIIGVMTVSQVEQEPFFQARVR
ncbi:AFUA 2G14950) [Echinococcus multilocularis]|uniref:Exonuclease (AFU orthologue) n=1 Tax=Echinococcus multilocularis TaxID=6211 RepID=A0A0S4MQ19_ECHMU|nr:AFUA 2G14950) [Echinococcus multilocularis]